MSLSIRRESERLIHPVILQSAAEFISLSFLHPSVEYSFDIILIIFSKLSPRHLTSPGFWRIKHFKQIIGSHAENIRPLHQRPPLRRHAPDSSMRMVPSLVAEIDFAMLNDRV